MVSQDAFEQLRMQRVESLVPPIGEAPAAVRSAVNVLHLIEQAARRDAVAHGGDRDFLRADSLDGRLSASSAAYLRRMGQPPVVSRDELEAVHGIAIPSSADADLVASIRERAYVGGDVTLPEAVPFTRPLPHLKKAETDEGLKENASEVYRASVSYHATDEASKQSIRRHGFQRALKTKGATEQSGFPDPDSSQYHYLTASRDRAKAFADQHLSGHPPAIVRVLGAGHAFPIESDPQSANSFEGFRTDSDIGPHLVLGSKHGPPAEDAEGFRQQLSQAGVQVDRVRAGELLREVQSDSEDEASATEVPAKSRRS